MRSSAMVNHTNVVKLELESIFSTLKDAESSLRGYLLTNENVFMEQFDHTLLNINAQVDHLSSITTDNLFQQQNIDVLKILISQRINYMKAIIKDANSEKIATERWLTGRNMMEGIRHQVNKMMLYEDKLLKIRTESLTRETSIAPLVTIFLTIFTILILIFSYYGIMRELKISNQLKENLETRKMELLKANISLQKSNTELESFTYISSHDLQEPLRKIQTFISRIIDSESEKLSENGKSYLKRTQESANRMQTLIRDLLAYSRLNEAVFPIKPTSLQTLVEIVKMDLEEEINEKKASVECIGIPEVKIIESQFRQLLINLISNSLKFSNPEIAPKIVIENKLVEEQAIPFEHGLDVDHFYEITVTDNGIGFDSKYQNRIFEVFQRLHADQNFEGTGIGLAIVKKIVQNHNGFITADSQVGRGARFTIYLPA